VRTTISALYWTCLKHLGHSMCIRSIGKPGDSPPCMTPASEYAPEPFSFNMRTGPPYLRVTRRGDTLLFAYHVGAANRAQSKGKLSRLFESKVFSSSDSQSSRTWRRRQTWEPSAQFDAGRDTEHENATAGHPDAPSALKHTRGPDIDAEQMTAHLKKGCGAQRTKPYAA
jgi:hypothetical protein